MNVSGISSSSRSTTSSSSVGELLWPDIKDCVHVWLDAIWDLGISHVFAPWSLRSRRPTRLRALTLPGKDFGLDKFPSASSVWMKNVEFVYWWRRQYSGWYFRWEWQSLRFQICWFNEPSESSTDEAWGFAIPYQLGSYRWINEPSESYWWGYAIPYTPVGCWLVCTCLCEQNWKDW